jgi:RNA-binding protein
VLNSKQRGRLSAIAQTRDSLVALGRAGMSPELASRLASLLDSHELVKLRFVGYKESKEELAARLAEATGSDLVRVIGNIAVFWKRNPDPEKRSLDVDF